MVSKTLVEAISCYQTGNFQRAKQICQQLLDFQPEQPKVINLLGMSDFGLGNYKQAVGLIKLAITLNPNYARAYVNLGVVLQSHGKLEEAVTHYRSALNIEPDCAEIYFRLGQVLSEQNQQLQALEHYRQALALNSDWLLCRQSFIDCLNKISFSSISPELFKELEYCFKIPEIDKQNLVRPTIVALKQQAEISRLLKLGKNLQMLESEFYRGGLNSFLNNSLFQSILRQTVITDLEFEIFLTNLRRTLLFSLSRDSSFLRSPGLCFACSLALQLFNNEYVFSFSPSEEIELNRLKTEIQSLLKEDLNKANVIFKLQYQLVIFGMYYPIYTLANSVKLLQIDSSAWDESIRPLIARQLLNHHEELKAIESIRTITTVENSVSLAVQSQYEENPYPRWLNLARKNPEPLSFVIQSRFSHFRPPDFLNQPLQILVAGCGTGRDAISIATRWRNVEVFAVDLSARSLSYAIRMAKKMQVDNISFYQGDLLKLSNLDWKFPVIFCAGVLHHLEAPVQGWQVLVNLLQPFGMMKVGLYSQKARKDIQNVRDLIQTRGFAATFEGIRQSRQAILELNNHPSVSKVSNLHDFFNLSCCRDLLFHAQEHQFTLPQVKNILDDLGLQFVGFEIDNPQIRTNYKVLFAEDYQMTNLFFWDKFEDMYSDTFLGMYQFWCQKVI